MFMDCVRFENVCPYRTDEPPQYDSDFIQAGGNTDEMKRLCLNRHNMAVNIAYVDFSVRKLQLRPLWDQWWHRNWPIDQPPPVWPDWLLR